MELVSWLKSIWSGEHRRLGRTLRELIDQARVFGLPGQDVTNAESYLEYNEYECAFDIIVVQLHEYNVSISAEYYQLVQAIAQRMSLPEESFSFVKELIK